MITKNDYVVMEVLVDGSWIKKDVLKTLENGMAIYLVGTKNAEGSYMMGGSVIGEKYREIMKKYIVKDFYSLVEQLKEDGYEYCPEDQEFWTEDSTVFDNQMFDYCGLTPSDTWEWKPQWLVEVTE